MAKKSMKKKSGKKKAGKQPEDTKTGLFSGIKMSGKI